MVTYSINLDLLKENYTSFKVKQNDDITLKFNMFNNSMLEDMTGATVILNALKADNTFVKQSENIIIANNNITIEALRDIARVPGELKLELVIIKNNKQKTTFSINVMVVNSVIADNAEVSKNVVSVIEELDNKISQGKEIVAEVERTKVEAINTVTKLKDDTITELKTIKEDTLKQLSDTTEDVRTLKRETIEESTRIKDNAITALEEIKVDSIKELNNIKDTANTDLNNIKKETINEVTKIAQEAIESINKYNIQDVSKKLDEHIKDNNIHVTKEIKDSIDKNTKDIDTVETSLRDNILTSFKTDVKNTKLERCAGGFVNIEKVQGGTYANLISINGDYKGTDYFFKYNTKRDLTKNKKLTFINCSDKTIFFTARNSKEESMIDYEVLPIKSVFVDFTLNDWSITGVGGYTKFGWTDENKNDLKKVMILEGDWTNKPIPQYFEGIKSVGENILTDNIYNPRNPVMDGNRINSTTGVLTNQDTYGDGHTDYLAIKPNTQYQFSGISDTIIPYAIYDSNKNYITGSTENLNFITPNNAYYVRFSLRNSNLNNIQLNLIQYRIEILSYDVNLSKDTTFQNGNIHADTGEDLSYGESQIVRTSFIECNRDSEIKVDSNYYEIHKIVGYDNNKKFIKTFVNVAIAKLPVNCKYIRVVLKNDTDISASDLVKIKLVTSYRQDKTEILSATPWREWDFTDINGVKTIGSGQITFNGKEGWVLEQTYANKLEFYTGVPNAKEGINPSICDNLKVADVDDVIVDNSLSNIICVDGRFSVARIGIKKSDLVTPDVEGLKQKLSQNPVTICYELKDSAKTTENTNKTLSLNAFTNCYLQINSGAIQPTVTGKYFTPSEDQLVKNLGIRLATLETKVGVLIESNYKDVTPPSTVSNLVAAAGDKEIKLSWINPTDADFEGVKIVRKEGNYPTSLVDGVVIFDGKNTSYTDKSLTNGTVYYYRVFTYDNNRNINSNVTGQQVSGTPVSVGIGGIDNNTILMLHGEDFTDNSLNPKTINNNGAILDNSGKFDKCLSFGNGKRLVVSPSSDFAFGMGDFTVECYVYLNNLGSENDIFVSDKNYTDFYFNVNPNGCLRITIGEASVGTMGTDKTTIATNQWTHVAVSRKSGVLRLFINGKVEASKNNSNPVTMTSPRIGYHDAYPNDYVNGKISELRVSKVCRYETDFIPPQSPFTKQGLTVDQKIDKLNQAGLLMSLRLVDKEMEGKTNV